jgi:hypothetical protein
MSSLVAITLIGGLSMEVAQLLISGGPKFGMPLALDLDRQNDGAVCLNDDVDAFVISDMRFWKIIETLLHRREHLDHQ